MPSSETTNPFEFIDVTGNQHERLGFPGVIENEDPMSDTLSLADITGNGILNNVIFGNENGLMVFEEDARSGSKNFFFNGTPKTTCGLLRGYKGLTADRAANITSNENSGRGMKEVEYGDIFFVGEDKEERLHYLVAPSRLSNGIARGFKLYAINKDAAGIIRQNQDDTEIINRLLEKLDSETPQIPKTVKKKKEEKEIEFKAPKWTKEELKWYKSAGGPIVMTFQEGENYQARDNLSDFQFPDLEGLDVSFEVRGRKVAAFNLNTNVTVASADKGEFPRQRNEIAHLDVVLLGGKFAYVMTKDKNGKYPPRMFAIPPSFFADIVDTNEVSKVKKISERLFKGGADLSSLISLIENLKELGELDSPQKNSD